MDTLKKILPVSLAALFCLGTAHGAPAAESETLTARQRVIVPIAAFTAAGNIPRLEPALVKGLEAGLTVNEVKEILVQAYAYAGFPRALNAIEAFMGVLEKRKAQGLADKAGRDAAPMPAGLDKTAYGHKVRNSLVGSDVSKRASGYPVFAPVIDRFLVEHLFADIFYRDVLTHQERELATISILAALPGTEAQLKGHLAISLNVGLSKAQLGDYVAVLGGEVDAESARRAAETLGALTGLSPAAKKAEPVKVIKKSEPAKAPADHFTGRVTVGSGFSTGGPGAYGGAVVNFEAGARTAWHKHPYGQTLVVISGRGLVRSEGEAVAEILPGDVVWIPENTRHWHGAAPDSPMSHVAISAPRNGSTVEWQEQVSDAEYGK